MEETAVKLIGSSLSDATKQSYNRTLLEFRLFLDQLPVRYNSKYVTPGHIVLYIADLFEKGFSSQTIVSKISAINYFCKLYGHTTLIDNFIVQKTLSGVKKLSYSSDMRIPLSMENLSIMVRKTYTVMNCHYYIVLLKAMMVTAFYAFLRPGEMTKSIHNLQFDNILLKSNVVVINFQSFKHCNGNKVTLEIHADNTCTCPVFHLGNYIDARGNKPGPLFCHPDKLPISYYQFSRWLQQLLRNCSIQGKINCHSFRIGATSLACIRGCSDNLIRQMGRWRSNAYLKYIRIPKLQF